MYSGRRLHLPYKCSYSLCYVVLTAVWDPFWQLRCAPLLSSAIATTVCNFSWLPMASTDATKRSLLNAVLYSRSREASSPFGSIFFFFSSLCINARSILPGRSHPQSVHEQLRTMVNNGNTYSRRGDFVSLRSMPPT